MWYASIYVHHTYGGAMIAIQRSFGENVSVASSFHVAAIMLYVDASVPLHKQNNKFVWFVCINLKSIFSDRDS